MTIAVQGERDAAVADHLLHEQELAAGILGVAEQRVRDRACGVVDDEQQGEARTSLLEPGVVAAVDLEQHPRPWHALAPHAVLWRATPPRAGPDRVRTRRSVGRLRTRPSCSSISSVRWVWLAPG